MAKSFSFSFFLFTREGKRKAKPRSWAEVNGQSKAGMNQKKALNHLFCTSRQCFEEEEEEEVGSMLWNKVRWMTGGWEWKTEEGGTGTHSNPLSADTEYTALVGQRERGDRTRRIVSRLV